MRKFVCETVINTESDIAQLNQVCTALGMTARKHTITRYQSNLVKYLNYCKTAFHEYPSINSVICSIHNYFLFDLHLLARIYRMQINSPSCIILATC